MSVPFAVSPPAAPFVALPRPLPAGIATPRFACADAERRP